MRPTFLQRILRKLVGVGETDAKRFGDGREMSWVSGVREEMGWGFLMGFFM